MAGRPPPPSFSSFPEPASASSRAVPPAFTSFPSPPREPHLAPGPKKRSRSGPTDFLDALGGELGIGSSAGHRSRGQEEDDREKERHRSRSGRHERERDERNRSRRSDKGKERERDRSRERKRSREDGRPRRRDEGDRKERRTRTERGESSGRSKVDSGLERETDYGAKTEKKYRLVHDIPSAPAAAAPFEGGPPNTADDKSERPLFYESRRGDENNIRYGGLHRGDIPRYRRAAGGKVLGLNEGLRITRETAYTGRGVEIAPLARFRTPRYVDPSSLRHLIDKSTKRLYLRPRMGARPLGDAGELGAESAEDEDDEEADFVALPREKTVAEKIDRLEHEEGTDYRSVAGLIKPSDLAEVSSDEDGGGDDIFSGAGISGGESHAEHLRRRNVELDRALRDEPNNVDKWLEFVNFQDELATSGSGETSSSSSSTKRALSKSERASTSEIKLAILDRALATPGNADAEPLLLAQLEAAAEIEDPQRVLKRWKDTLAQHPDLTGLWIEYVSSRQTTWATFSVPDLIGVYEESLAVLVDAMDRPGIDQNRREVLESNAIYLLLRFCLMLRQAGFSERATATFQALVEFNLFRPHEFERSQQERVMPWRERLLQGFEAFWDGEAPRIGEEGAKGWAATSADDLPPDASEATTTGEVSVQDPAARPHERWATAERAASNADLPARTTDPGMDESDDPYRVVLFDDVRPFLLDLEAPDSKHQLAYAFLTFVGLPFMPVDVPTSTPFTTDPFIHSELLERPGLLKRYWPTVDTGDSKPFSIVAGEPMEREARSDLKTPWETPFHASPTAVDVLFGGGRPGWFTAISAADLEDVDVSLARNTLSLLRSVLSDQFLVLDAFAFEAAHSPKSAVKLAKQVLRDRRHDLALWDGYARIERQRGKIAEARQVYCTALSMYRSFAPEDQIDGPLLWRAWAEMEWEDGRPAVALKVLCAATDDEKPDLASIATSEPDARPTRPTILRSRQYYTQELEASFQPNATQAIVRNRNHLAYSFALFEYLTRNLPAAVDVLERHLFRLDCADASGSAEHEEALAMYAKLLHRHMLFGGGYRPAQLRKVLERAIEQFPNDSLFLNLFYHNELRMRIQNHFRRVLEEQVLKDDRATSEGWLFSIYSELHLDARRPNIWAIRNLFDRALDNPRTRSAPSLWTLYIDFEVRNGEYRRAKSLIYRAIRECPWCKEFYLRPFSPMLRSVFRSRELRDFHHLLLEKGLRIRVDVEAFLDGEQTSDMELEDDEHTPNLERLEHAGEEVLTERQRLMPY
ncbi:hypothetical protein JCM10908_001742 [Rhodotorula pacifica]|uniref:uncharacterized protein n=1 Tax=Rhodotorula pacifica TaxID=1495444 RepID=UPI00317D4A5C